MISTLPEQKKSAPKNTFANGALSLSENQQCGSALSWVILYALNITSFGMFTTTLLSTVQASIPNVTAEEINSCLQVLEQQQAVFIDRTGPGSQISWSVTLTCKGKDIANYKVEPTFVLARPQIF